MTMSPFGILAGLALVASLAAASTLTVSPSGLYSGLTVRIEAHSSDPDGDCSDVLDNLEVGQGRKERVEQAGAAGLLAVTDRREEALQRAERI